MSIATTRLDGGGHLERFHFVRRARLPYLRRNVRRAVHSLTMGSAASALSSFRRSTGPRSRQAPTASDDDDEEEDIRPTKRRRINGFDDISANPRHANESGLRQPLDHVTNESTRGPSGCFSSKPQAVNPAEFYGKSRSTTPAIPPSRRLSSASKRSKTDVDKIVVLKEPVDFKKSLRVDILGIVPGPNVDSDLWGLVKHKATIDIKCRCQVAVFYASNDEDPGGIIRSQDYIEICRTVKTGVLRITFKESGDIVRDLIFPEPFYFSSQEFYVSRKSRRSTASGASGGNIFDYGFGFAPKYSLQVVLESLYSQKDWPSFLFSRLFEDGTSTPIDQVLKGGNVTENDLHLYCKTNPFSDPDRQSRDVVLQLAHKSLKQTLPYCLRLEVSWSLPSHLSTLLPIRTPKIESPGAVVAAASTLPQAIPASPLARRHEDFSNPNSPADRAQRRRSNVATYNLKTLSAQAQGKSPRVRRTRDEILRAELGLSENEGLTVEYAFGRAEATELAVKQRTVVTNLNCPFCECNHRKIEHLRLHLHTDHSSFKFRLRRGPPRVTFFVECVDSRSNMATSYERARTIQLGKPMTLYDLEKHLNGDEGWTKAREGPQHNMWPEHLQHLVDQAHESSLSSSPHDSRHSSPNTSNDTDEMVDPEPHELKLPVRPRKKFLVPKTDKPLYDSITKRVLQPGEEIPNSDDEKDEGWLHQRHRDVIMDFTDVTDDEKDYIIRWNPFIVEEHLTSEKFLPEACIRFAEANKSWFAKKRSRKWEFAIHLETFVMRGVITQTCFHKCFDILREGEKMEELREKENVDMDKGTEEVAPSKQRGELDCVCCEPTPASDRVICRGRVSFEILFFIWSFLALLTQSPRNAQGGSFIVHVRRNLDDQSWDHGNAINVSLNKFNAQSSMELVGRFI
jgi:hypothetical protein